MPNFQLGDTEQVAYAITVLDGDSNPATLAPGTTVTVVSSNTAALSVEPDTTPAAGSVASGLLVGGTKLATGVSVTATVTLPGVSAPFVAVDLIDVVGGTANSISIGLSAPVSQTAAAPPAPSQGAPTS